jgi:hypothetical protein
MSNLKNPTPFGARKMADDEEPLQALAPAPRKPPSYSQFWAFQFLSQTEAALRERIPAVRFSERLTRAYRTQFPDDDPPDAKLLAYLYEQAFSAALTYEYGLACERILGSEQWIQHRQWSHSVVEQLEQLTRTLARMVSAHAPLNLRHQAEDVLQQLEPLSDFISTMQRRDEVVEQAGTAHLYNSSLQTARSALDRTLRKQAAHLSREKRLQLISSAIVAIGLKEADEVDATSRALSRRNRRLRRR